MGRARAPAPADPLADPLAYPWAAAGRAGVLGADAYDPVDVADLDAALRRHARPGLAARTPVVAVGANASPAVLRAKLARLGADPVLPLAPARLGGLAVGHSAHVSVRGYVAAAAYRTVGAVAVVLAWPTAGQLACLDRTEPTYRRVRLDPAVHPLRCGGTSVAAVEVYDSLAGVLAARGGRPLPFGPQEVALRRVAEVCGLPPLPAPELARRLAGDPDARARVRRQLASAGAALPAGLAVVTSAG